MGLIAVISMCAAVIVGIIVFFVMRGMKGTITLQCEKNTFDPGETIKGTISVKIKKETRGNQLKVSLIADRTTTFYDGDERRTDHDEIYRDELVLEDKKTYPVGYENTYDFSINIPKMNEPGGQQTDGVLGAVGAVFDVLSANRRKTKIEWQLEARLDAEGLDLVTKKEIHMRMMQG
jgi:hypothetical protein